MIKFLNKIEKSSNPFPVDHGFYLFTREKELLKYNNQFHPLWKLKIDTWSQLYFINEDEFYSYSDRQKFIHIKEGKIISEIVGYSPFGCYDRQTVFLSSDGVNRKLFTLDNSYKADKLLFQGVSSPQLLYSDKLFCGISISKYECYSISQKVKLWEIDFQEKLYLHAPTIYKHVAFGGHLYVYIKDDRNPEKSHVYCIDLETGEIVAEYPDFKGYVSVFDRYIYTTRYSFIQRFNPETKVLENIDIEQELKKNGFREMDFTRWLVKDNYMYFVQNFGDVQARVGIVDLSTQTIVDEIVLDRKNGSIGSIKVHNNRLYILSQDSTLHIYEVERKTSPTEPMY